MDRTERKIRRIERKLLKAQDAIKGGEPNWSMGGAISPIDQWISRITGGVALLGIGSVNLHMLFASLFGVISIASSLILSLQLFVLSVPDTGKNEDSREDDGLSIKPSTVLLCSTGLIILCTPVAFVLFQASNLEFSPSAFFMLVGAGAWLTSLHGWLSRSYSQQVRRYRSQERKVEILSDKLAELLMEPDLQGGELTLAREDGVGMLSMSIARGELSLSTKDPV